MSKKENNNHRYPLAVRIACIVLTVLVASGGVVYLITAIMNLLGK